MRLEMPDRVHCMDVKGDWLVVGTADRNLSVYYFVDGSGFQPVARYLSPLVRLIVLLLYLRSNNLIIYCSVVDSSN